MLLNELVHIRLEKSGKRINLPSIFLIEKMSLFFVREGGIFKPKDLEIHGGHNCSVSTAFPPGSRAPCEAMHAESPITASI